MADINLGDGRYQPRESVHICALRCSHDDEPNTIYVIYDAQVQILCLLPLMNSYDSYHPLVCSVLLLTCSFVISLIILTIFIVLNRGRAPSSKQEKSLHSYSNFSEMALSASLPHNSGFVAAMSLSGNRLSGTIPGSLLVWSVSPFLWRTSVSKFRCLDNS